ncbi:NUDIX hydrolase [Acetobacteraceae bacterium]|nr:NUDIX hydrolase [Acetobacteraceae bacterium]
MENYKKPLSREELFRKREADGYQLLSTKLAYKNPWLQVTEKRFVDPTGRKGFYGILERDQFAVIIPLHADGRITFIRQYRYPVAQTLLELPMGMWEARPDADILDLARGELEEETGLRAKEMLFAGSFFQGAGYSDQRGSVFLAKGLIQGQPHREASENDMCTVEIEGQEIKGMIARGQFECMVTLSALMTAHARGLLPFWK